MYPLNMKSAAGGYAVANDEHEHRSLTGHGYEPGHPDGPLEDDDGSSDGPTEFEQLKAEATARGIKVNGSWGVKKLREVLAQ